MMQNRLNSLLIVIFMLILFTPEKAISQNRRAIKASTIENKIDASSSTYRISLLTCSAGEEIYAYFGHTAIRVENFSTKEDYVYNYGQFNMDQPHFIWHFTLGQTDYQMGKETFNHFARIYTYINRTVYAQVLNLNDTEAKTLVENLNNNYKPQNRNYIYNYFYDNCSTRPFFVIKNSIEGTLHFSKKYQPKSWREEINKYTSHASWGNFGMNLLLGAPTDKEMSEIEQLFLPINLEQTLQSSEVKSKDGNTKPLILQRCQIIQRDEERAVKDRKESTPPISATTASILFLILTLLITFIDYKRKKISIWFDTTLYIIFGLIGFILIFMGLFSSHPCLNPNYEILLFNPLFLIGIGSLVRLSKPKREQRYISKSLLVSQTKLKGKIDQAIYLIISLCLIYFTITCILQLSLNMVTIQYFPPASLALALCLLVRLLFIKKWTRNNRQRQKSFFTER